MSAARDWLRQTLSYRFRRARVRTRAWLMRHPRIKVFLRRTGSLEVDEYTLARGVALGLFIGLTPTVGVQTVLMLAASALLRANFPAAFIASWLNNPVTFPAFYFAYNRLGQQLLPLLPLRFGPPYGLEQEIVEQTTALILGSLAVATPTAVIGYFVFLYVWRRFDLHIPARARDEEE